MTIIEVKNRTTILINKLLEVWEDSVKATHLFLSNKDLPNFIYEIMPKGTGEVDKYFVNLHFIL